MRTFPNNQALLEQDTDILLSHLYRPVSPDEQARLELRAGDSPTTRLAIQQLLNIDKSVTNRPISMALLRMLTFLSFDYSNKRLVFDPNVQLRDPLRSLSPDDINALKDFSNPSNNREPPSGRGGKTNQHGPRLGRRDVLQLAKLDSNGIYWRYYCLAPFGFFPTLDKVHMASWYLSSSPVIFTAINLIMKQLANQEKYGRRTLALVDSPYAQL